MNIYSSNILLRSTYYYTKIARISHTRRYNTPKIPTPLATTPLQEYDKQVKLGKLKNDPFQRSILTSLTTFYQDLTSYYSPELKTITMNKFISESPGWTTNLFNKVKSLINNNSDQADKLKGSELHIGDQIPRGIYLFGDVGCGKTMLMDLVYNTIPPHLTKRRIHFHQFMQDVHKRSHEILKEYHERSGTDGDIDTVPILANEIAHQGRVLCFDEFQVTDVADAMILRRLFSLLLSNEYGVVLFATSNRHPDELYINGIQRQSFIPCIELIKRRTNVINLNSQTDYRRIPRPISSVYIYPKDTKWGYDSKEFQVRKKLHIEAWYNYFAQPATSAEKISTDNNMVQTQHDIHHDYPLSIWGRQFIVPKCTPPRVAQFTFDQLCGQPLAAGDYLTLAKNFKAFIVTDIPYLSIDIRDQIRRFITFLDAIYDNGGKLATTGANKFTSLFVEPNMLENSFKLKDLKSSISVEKRSNDEQSDIESVVQNSQIFTQDEERFAFARALSRLSQMSTTDWVSR